MRLRGIFGALRDASPDAWGRRVIEHALKVSALTEVQYLLESPEDRIGAQWFSADETPPAGPHRYNKTSLVRARETKTEDVEGGRQPRVGGESSSLALAGVEKGTFAFTNEQDRFRAFGNKSQGSGNLQIGTSRRTGTPARQSGALP